MQENDIELVEHLRKSVEETQKNIEFMELHLGEFIEKGWRERIVSIMSQLAFCKYCDNKQLRELTGTEGEKG